MINRIELSFLVKFLAYSTPSGVIARRRDYLLRRRHNFRVQAVGTLFSRWAAHHFWICGHNHSSRKPLEDTCTQSPSPTLPIGSTLFMSLDLVATIATSRNLGGAPQCSP